MSYGYDYSVTQGLGSALEGAAGILLGVIVILYLLVLAFSIVSYVLYSMGLYRIAKRRGIHHPWLAWIPVGSSWLLGSISDHYQFVAKQKNTKRRKVLLILCFALTALWIAMMAILITGVITAAVDESILVMVALLVVIYLVMLGILIAVAVFQYIALYDLFQSSKPNNAVLFLVLGIFFSVTLPFFVFACSRHDKGMPERKPQIPEQAEPEAEPEVTVEAEAPAQEEEIPVVEAEVVEDPE